MINRPGSGLLIVVLSVVLPRVPNTSEGGQTPLAPTLVPPSGSILVGFYRIFLDPFCGSSKTGVFPAEVPGSGRVGGISEAPIWEEGAERGEH